ncbi:MAG: zf-HC2 domain-containing protein [Ruminococcaceae bacterium]|nr:zf-HC2 domain-containing protein [Oscillospiraceae bacterium]
MNKTSCNIIKDILPLYVDEVVSDETRNMVSEHIKQCEGCRRKYEEVKADISLPIENNTKPLKNFKSAWKRKKALIICSTIVATIAIMCCVMLAVNHFAYKEEIAVNGAVYTQKGENLNTLPDGCVELGYLRGISHKSTENPTEDFSATNLDEKYAGCPIYQSADNEQIIYLEDYSGFYIPFELSEYIVTPEQE